MQPKKRCPACGHVLADPEATHGRYADWCDLHLAGWTPRQIATKYRLSHSAISGGIMRERLRRGLPGLQQQITQVHRERAARMIDLRDSGQTTRQIADAFGGKPGSVLGCMRREESRRLHESYEP
jgi:IS30 family transposase